MASTRWSGLPPLSSPNERQRRPRRQGKAQQQPNIVSFPPSQPALHTHHKSQSFAPHTPQASCHSSLSRGMYVLAPCPTETAHAVAPRKQRQETLGHRGAWEREPDDLAPPPFSPPPNLLMSTQAGRQSRLSTAQSLWHGLGSAHGISQLAYHGRPPSSDHTGSPRTPSSPGTGMPPGATPAWLPGQHVPSRPVSTLSGGCRHREPVWAVGPVVAPSEHVTPRWASWGLLSLSKGHHWAFVSPGPGLCGSAAGVMDDEAVVRNTPPRSPPPLRPSSSTLPPCGRSSGNGGGSGSFR